MTESLSIGQLARRTGTKVPTVRYYESIGLLEAPARSDGNQRRYGPAHVARLDFIQHCRELGFSQPAIREVLALADHPGDTCEAVTGVVSTHLDDVRRRIARLSRLEAELERMLDQCHGGTIAECRILQTLGDHTHTHCLSDAHAEPSGREDG